MMLKILIGSVLGVASWEIMKPLGIRALRWYWRLESRKGWNRD